MGSFKFEMTPDVDPASGHRSSRRMAWVVAGVAVAAFFAVLVAVNVFWPGG